MVEIEDIIATFLPILDTPRRIGKTTKLRILAHELHGTFVEGINPFGKEISVSNLYDEIRGRRGPVIFDTTALEQLFGMCLERIQELKNFHLREQMNTIKIKAWNAIEQHNKLNFGKCGEYIDDILTIAEKYNDRKS